MAIVHVDAMVVPISKQKVPWAPVWTCVPAWGREQDARADQPPMDPARVSDVHSPITTLYEE